jgi:hypothetical protein
MFMALIANKACSNLTMKSIVITCMASPFDINPLTRMWHLVTTFPILVCNFLKYVISTKLGMVESTQCGSWKVLFYIGFYEVKILQHAHYLPTTCSTHGSTLYKISICKMHWAMERNKTTILLWWLNIMLCVIIGSIFA